MSDICLVAIKGRCQVAQYLAADEAKQKKLSSFFVGQIMKASKGQANPQMVNQLLLKKLNDQS